MKLNNMQKSALWGLNEFDGINYNVEKLLNKLFKSDTDYLYRQYIEIAIEEARTFALGPREYCNWIKRNFMRLFLSNTTLNILLHLRHLYRFPL